MDGKGEKKKKYIWIIERFALFVAQLLTHTPFSIHDLEFLDAHSASIEWTEKRESGSNRFWIALFCCVNFDCLTAEMRAAQCKVRWIVFLFLGLACVPNMKVHSTILARSCLCSKNGHRIALSCDHKQFHTAIKNEIYSFYCCSQNAKKSFWLFL